MCHNHHNFQDPSHSIQDPEMPIILNYYKQTDYLQPNKYLYNEMPNSRKRQHSRSRSKSPLCSEDRTDCDIKRKKYDDGEKAHMESSKKVDLPKKSLSSEPEIQSEANEKKIKDEENDANIEVTKHLNSDECNEKKQVENKNGENLGSKLKAENSTEKQLEAKSDSENNKSNVDQDSVIVSDDEHTPSKSATKQLVTPKKGSCSKKLFDSEKKRLQKEKEKEERMRKKNEEKERIIQEKLKKKEEKRKEIEQKQKEKEEKEEKKKKEREEKEQQRKQEKEQKRKEKEEKEEQKRKEREQEKIKKQQEIEEKNREKTKEEEKKQKAAVAFVSFFVPKKTDCPQEDKKNRDTIFMPFEVKSDMKLSPPRRSELTEEEKENLIAHLVNQSDEASYLKDLKCGKTIGRSSKTWPSEESASDDVIIVDLGETICEDKSKFLKLRVKFLKFHENRRPAYFGTWRKQSRVVTPRRPFGEDKGFLNYEEDSDDDWEDEEQGESLNGSEDEADKETEEEKDDYEVDNDFFVPHGHLSDDEVDDEEKARLSPESLKQKLKLLKEEFEQDMQSKTNKLKPRSIGCIWYNKDGSNVEEALDRYLQPLAIISNGPIVIKKRSDIVLASKYNKIKLSKELDPEHIPAFLKIVHGNTNRKIVVVEQFLNQMEKSGLTVKISKATLIKKLKQFAKWKKCEENGPMKNKFGWFVNNEVKLKYDVDLS